ncbi:iron-sulfur cluster assembly scaffold protein NifU [Desulfobacca acetoxidans]|uniref:Nitrogen-fixing NifU domain protein n=1 Tax=Desulfobacca acetoxidans (strain ATCC 700848 / DSM 11109 / ASRB2) TaxID=880072 RepID=F2NHF7_DESAR|nr:iron-sulfur cluster assembly scaffold protein NifU [Desulfobacca acetoxidans]AEB09073.1 nitrogen-fixing NifU domain protein [Desulfobacca acetoxidans DSM 11109]HAY21350.1 iron-sulfur cluster assembly scaffold protein NifU [Desulfobacterales bacterium]
MSDDDFPVPGEVGEQFFRIAKYPKNIGAIKNPSGRGTAVGVCGDSIEVSLQIEMENIADIKVLPRGCVYTLVCASAMSELAKGRNVDQALDLEPQDVVNALGGLPEDHLHCARLAVNTLGEAIADYYRRVSQSGIIITPLTDG